MKMSYTRIFLLVIVLSLSFSGQATAQSLPAPNLTITQDGDQITVSWAAVPGAQGYRLYYAPYPSLTPANSIDLGAELEVTTQLEALDSYVIGIIAYNSSEESPVSNTPVAQLDIEKSGGDTSIMSLTSDAFSTPVPTLTEQELGLHQAGDVGFETTFAPAPSDMDSGLGPVFNHSSCLACHDGDGRDAAPGHGEMTDTMLFKLSLPGTDPVTGGVIPVPGFGSQLATKANMDVQPEASVVINYTEETIVLTSGREVNLRTPTYDGFAYMEPPGNMLFSPRIGPPIFGRGLLEAIPEETILALADENDLDGDGISGKANFVWDPVTESTVLGRFGLKANNPNLLIQTAGAFNQDIGITTSVFSEENSQGQIQDDSNGDDPELDDDILDAVTFFVRTLAVPSRRDVTDPEVEQGQLVFAQAGCASCHIPTLQTGDSDVSPALANQTIHPYTDMLLHDMGPGLADFRPDFLATGREWKTPPLWGIGLTEIVNGHTSFLHDGRARNVLEAIMWHGGEALAARDYVVNLPEHELDALLEFINSL